jgi:hypothetical protein
MGGGADLLPEMMAYFPHGVRDLIDILFGVIFQQLHYDPTRKCTFGHRTQTRWISSIRSGIA